MNSPNPYGGYGRNSNYAPLNQTAQAQATLLQRVSYLLCTALLCTAGAAYVSRDWSPALGLPLFIGAFVCVIALNFVKRTSVAALTLLYALSLLEGFALGPFLASLIHNFPNGGMIVAEATALSAIIVGGLGSYVWISNKDFGYLGKMLFYGLLAIIGVSLISLFWHTLAVMPQFQILISLAIVVVFVGFTLYDFSNIKHRYGPDDAIPAAVQLYLDFLNLFMAIIRILMAMNGGGSRQRD